MSEPRTFEIPPELAKEFDDVIAQEEGLDMAMTSLAKAFQACRRRSRGLWFRVQEIHPDLPLGSSNLEYNTIRKAIVEKP